MVKSKFNQDHVSIAIDMMKKKKMSLIPKSREEIMTDWSYRNRGTAKSQTFSRYPIYAMGKGDKNAA